jgi:hypothetical protein
MNLRKLVIGSQLLFVREGTVIGTAPGNTVSQLYKPEVEAQAPYVNWASLGEVQDFTPTPKTNETDIVAPSPGAFRRTDVITTSTTLDLSFSLFNVSELFFESILLAGGPITANAYQPGVGSGQVRGWLKCQQYDQGDVLRNVFDVYVSGTFKGAKQENKLIIAQLDCKVLYSALQSGNLTLGN